MLSIASRTAMFKARREQWPEARDFIDAFCEGARVSRERCMTTRLILEKLFLSTVKYGQRGGSDAPIWITLSAEEGKVTFTYEDRAPPFNPFPRERDSPRTNGDPRTESVLNVLQTHGLTASADYTYLFGRNRVQLTLD